MKLTREIILNEWFDHVDQMLQDQEDAEKWRFLKGSDVGGDLISQLIEKGCEMQREIERISASHE